MKYSAMIVILVILISGCTGTVNESVRGATQPVGTALAVPQSMTQGVAAGYVDQTGRTTPNPYNR